MNKSYVVGLLLVASLLCVCVKARGQAGAEQSFEKDGVSFKYPEGWTLTDRSNADAQQLIMTRQGSAAVVSVVVYRGTINSGGQLIAASENIWRPYAEGLARKLGITKNPPWEETSCVDVGERPAVGVSLVGQFNGRPTTGEVYAVMLGRRFVQVAYIRPDAEDAQAAPAWKTVIGSLKVEEPADAPPLPENTRTIVSGGVLTGRALKKARPEYPPTAKAARASGVVVVQIVVDEQGNVTSAQAVAGHPLLREASEDSARRWKFSPTKLCGRPVKVTGTITVAFTLM